MYSALVAPLHFQATSAFQDSVRTSFWVIVQGRFEEALKDYTAAIQLNPQHCRAFYNRAFSNDRLRRYDAAVSDYTRALEIQPGNATAYHNRASLFERLGRSLLLSIISMLLPNCCHNLVIASC